MNRLLLILVQLIFECLGTENNNFLSQLQCSFDISCKITDAGEIQQNSGGSDYSAAEPKQAELFLNLQGSEQLMSLGIIKIPKPQK